MVQIISGSIRSEFLDNSHPNSFQWSSEILNDWECYLWNSWLGDTTLGFKDECVQNFYNWKGMVFVVFLVKLSNFFSHRTSIISGILVCIQWHPVRCPIVIWMDPRWTHHNLPFSRQSFWLTNHVWRKYLWRFQRDYKLDSEEFKI